MRWPWKRQGSGDQLVVSWSGQVLAYVLARSGADGAHEVLKFGVERQGTDSREDFVRRLQGLGLRGFATRVMLRPEQYQLLQIDAPAVAPEELRSAARWQIREMLDAHVDDITLDVMRVGDGQDKGAAHLFVVAATNAVLREVLDLGQAMNWSVSVIDIQETAQRNLQTALDKRDGRVERPSAALVLVDESQALLTISANEELFYTRRLELPEGFMAQAWGQGAEVAGAPASPALANDYIPDYNVGGVSYGTDYSGSRYAEPAGGDAGSNDRAQRFLVEVQRSLDLWDRSWSSMPLDAVRVFAGARSGELAQWLSQALGQGVTAMDATPWFPGFEGGAESDRAFCWPLLGVLMRTESRKL